MNSQARVKVIKSQQIIGAILGDESITDSVILFARGLLPHATQSDLTDKATLEEALRRCYEQRSVHQGTADLSSLAQTYLALGLCHLCLESGDDALESFQICAEMSEAHGERITQAWALAFHGLTKRALYELLKEDGLSEIEEARRLFEGAGYELGARVIEERFLCLRD